MSDQKSSSPTRKSLVRNWISLSGIVIALGSFFSFLFLLTIDLFAHHGNPYMGILAYVIAPGFLILGLVLVAVGIYQQYRHYLKHKELKDHHPFTIDLTRSRDRKILGTFIGGTMLFLLLSAIGSYQTYHYTDSVNFCGQTCHTPMKPEYTTYLQSPHAQVSCTECHVGKGAEWYIKAKINGVNQLYQTAMNSYHRPIETPLKNMRPAQEICGSCHWRDMNVANIEKVYNHYLMDEENTHFAVRMLLKMGDDNHGPHGGNHWHMNLENKVEFIATDEQRQEIPWVRFTDGEGKVTEYREFGFEEDPSNYTIHTMDCMDCHNRPAHQFKTPNDMVDLAMARGRIDTSLPWAKSNVVAVVSQEFETEPEALAKIESDLRRLYPDYEQLNSLVLETQSIFQKSIFPEMNADWRSYPDNIGHKNWDGCFRCHDGLHQSVADEVILSASDCNSCHVILSQGTGDELNTLNPEGEDFWHIDAPYLDFSCADCHNGGVMEPLEF